MVASFLQVGVTRLELATPSSRTKYATNCATPRLCTAKLLLFSQSCKKKRKNLRKNLEVSKKSRTFALAIKGNALYQGWYRAVYGTWFAFGAIAQLVEQRTENPCVTGSIPVGTTKKQ